MAFFNGMNISASGMTAQRLRMDLISQNIANVNTTRTENGEPYRRKTLLFAEQVGDSFENVLSKSNKGKFSEMSGNGVKAVGVATDYVTQMKKVYEPSHPDADAEGYVSYPNVNSVTEMTNLIDASRSYEANVTAFNATKNMLLKGLEVGK